MRPRELYAWIDEHHDGSSIALSCQVLGVRREGYYEWKHRPMRTDRDAQLVSALKEARSDDLVQRDFTAVMPGIK